MARTHNFSAGPAALPLPVLTQLQEALVEFGSTGAGIMEISHRSKAFDAVIDGATTRLRRVLGVPDDYSIAYLQGGASLQFYMVPLNLLRAGEAADFVVTGSWTSKAVKEAARIGDAKAIWDGKPEGFVRIPAAGDYAVRDEAVYVHYTSNNTIAGTQWHRLPESGGKPLVCDMSSDICSRPVDVSAHGLIFAGAQKNLGPSGVTAVILSPWALERSPGGLTPMLDYRTQIDQDSRFNTPNTFGIYALERVLAWVEDSGGLTAMAARNKKKAETLYAELDRTGFWRPHARPDSRSEMNINWRIADQGLEPRFIAEADAAGLKALKGHRSVGGIRASLYNATGQDAVDALVAFMREFERANG